MPNISPDRFDDRFNRLDASAAALASKLDRKDYTSAWLGLAGSLVGVIVGAVVTVLTQHLKSKQDRELASERAKLEIGNSFVQWQLQQLSDLYGPLNALLQQSQSLYRHMNSVLIGRDDSKFCMLEGVETDRADGKEFQIRLDGEWVRFRTVLHINQVYGRGYDVEDYFDEISDIGARMITVIREKAGYARPEQVELVPLFGKYLAHQAVLERLVNHYKQAAGRGQQAISGRTASDIPWQMPIKVDESAVFPGDIQNVVATGYRAITNELNAWRAKATT